MANFSADEYFLDIGYASNLNGDPSSFTFYDRILIECRHAYLFQLSIEFGSCAFAVNMGTRLKLIIKILLTRMMTRRFLNHFSIFGPQRET